MKERRFEIVLVDNSLVAVARYVRTFSSWAEALLRADDLNRDLANPSSVCWIARQNDNWLEPCRE